jgi:hypothetical protein
MYKGRRNSEFAIHFIAQVLILLNNYARFLTSRQLTTNGQTRGHDVLTIGPMLLSLVRYELVTPVTVRYNTLCILVEVCRHFRGAI